MRRFPFGFTLLLLLTPAVPARAEPMTASRFDRLIVMVETKPHRAPEFGKIRQFMRRLQSAGRDCRIDRSWSYGAYVLCAAETGIAADRVLFVLRFTPTLLPEYLHLYSIQPKGTHGSELTDPQAILAFTKGYLKAAPKH